MLKLSRPVVNLMCNAIENVSVISSRTLFAPSFFNVDKFANHSNYMQKKEANSKNDVRKIIEKSMSDGNSKMFTEDLKTLLYLTQNQDEFDFVVNAVKMYYNQAESGVFNFHFGMPLMRCAYSLNLTDKMFELTMSGKYSFLSEVDSVFTITMNKLFEEKRYDDVLKVFSKALEATLKKDIKIEGKGPFMPFVTSQLAFETLLEMNDPNALELAKELNQTLNTNKVQFNKLSNIAMILLALNQNDYQFAYEAFLGLEKKSQNQLNAAERNLKVQILLKLGNVEEALNEYNQILGLDSNSQRQSKFFEATLAAFKEVSQSANSDLHLKIDDALSRALNSQFPYEMKAFFFREQTISPSDRKKEREKGSFQTDGSRNFGDFSPRRDNRFGDFKQKGMFNKTKRPSVLE